MGVTNSKSKLLQQVQEPTKYPIDCTKTRHLNDDLETVELPVDDVSKEMELSTSPGNENRFSDIPITEAEKMRHIYRTEIERCATPEYGRRSKRENKEKPIHQYKTSDYHESGRKFHTPVVDKVIKQPEQNSALGCIVQTQESEAQRESSSSPVVVSDSITSKSSDRSIGGTIKRSPHFQQSASREHGPNSVSKKPPKSRSKKSEKVKAPKTGLRPLVTGQHEQEKSHVRTELEQQGLLHGTAGQDLDATQQGILGELRQVGIVHKVTAADVYTMSSGQPTRRPPPRLPHLPGRAADIAADTLDNLLRPRNSFNNMLDNLIKPRPSPNNTLEDMLKTSTTATADKLKPPLDLTDDPFDQPFTVTTEPRTSPMTVDRTSPVSGLQGSVRSDLSGLTTMPLPSADVEANSEYFGTLGTEKVGDAEKLKLKLFDIDML